MKPPAFDYIAADSIAMAVKALAQAGDDAKIIAGGQSLVPMLNFRLLRPSVLVDINRISGLDVIAETSEAIHVGALTRHYQLETSPLIARHLPMMALLLDAKLRVASASGERTIAARDFFLGALTVDLAPGEIITAVALPKLPPRTGWGFEEVARRHGDFALAAVAATLTVVDGAISQARIALTGVGPTALRATAAEGLLIGHALEPYLSKRVIEAVRTKIEPETDLHASSDYRRHLAGVLTGRALAAAWRRAHESAA